MISHCFVASSFCAVDRGLGVNHQPVPELFAHQVSSRVPHPAWLQPPKELGVLIPAI
jgi:hypothetical protein